MTAAAGQPAVRYDRAAAELVIGTGSAEVRREVDDEGFFVVRDEVAQTGATALRRALVAARRREVSEGIEWEIGLTVASSDFEVIDLEYAMAGPVSLVLSTAGELMIDVNVLLPEYPDDDRDFVPRLNNLLTPLLIRRSAAFVGAETSAESAAPPYVVTIRVKPTTRSRTVDELLLVGEEVAALVDAAEGADLHLSRTTARDLVLGGRADLLIGQPEGPWLDVKSQAYDLTRDAGKISLAQDVAKFANAEEGGLLVVGMDAKKIAGGEIIKSIRPVSIDGKEQRRYEQAIANRLYPPPEFLTIERVDLQEGGQLLLIDVPPQPEEHKPFLVHGAIVNGKVEGAFISIIRRRGEASIPTEAQAIHSTLAAGRALLRRGRLPEDRQAPKT